MLDKLKNFFKKKETVTETLSISESILLLLFEIAWADHNISEKEVEHIKKSIKPYLSLTDPPIDELIEKTKVALSKSSGIQKKTQHIMQSFSLQDRKKILLALWEIAYIDGTIASEEEGMLRKISDLLYLGHSDFIRSKQLTRQKLKSLNL